ncbi:hypothetical protein KR032_004925, partial [Drosophila birchii]
MSQNEATPFFEDYLVCPYNSAHRLMPSRLGMHLARCARNYPFSKLVRCTFNDTHLYTVFEMKISTKKEFMVSDSYDLCFDLRNTSRAVQIDSQRGKNMKPDKMPPSTESEPRKFVVESTDNWDEEPPVLTYN